MPETLSLLLTRHPKYTVQGLTTTLTAADTDTDAAAAAQCMKINADSDGLESCHGSP